MEAQRTAQPESDLSCPVSAIQGDTPGSASNGPSEPQSQGIEMKRAHAAAADPASGRSHAYEEMSCIDLRKLAKAKETSTNKYVGGKRVNMQKEELVEAHRAFDPEQPYSALLKSSPHVLLASHSG